MRTDRRKRYDDESRREALELIKAGAGGRSLARRLAMPEQTARNRILPYRPIGEEVVTGAKGNRRYDWETKVVAARDRVENGATKAEAMARCGIVSIAALERWCREYRASGAEALHPKPKDRRRARGPNRRPSPRASRSSPRMSPISGPRSCTRKKSGAISCGPGSGQQKRLLAMLSERLPADATPIPHSDMGRQYQHRRWHGELERLGIRQSMNRKGNCLDDTTTEQAFGHLKDEFHGDGRSARTSGSGPSSTRTSCTGTPSAAGYDSRDAPRRNSGERPSWSEPVS